MKLQYFLGYLESKAIIEKKRLVKLVEKNGFNHPGVIAQSQKLDDIIIKIQKNRLAGFRILENVV